MTMPDTQASNGAHTAESKAATTSTPEALQHQRMPFSSLYDPNWPWCDLRSSGMPESQVMKQKLLFEDSVKRREAKSAFER